MFSNYTESGSPLLTDPDAKTTATFLLERTNTTIANTLRRCILTETRSAGFRADLTNQADPGVKIRRNTSVIFNEMLAHRLTLVPLGVRRLDEFDPSRYECVLRIKNDRRGPITPENMVHVRAGDFVVRERGADGTMVDLPPAAAAAMFPPDPITRDTCLLVSLRPQWSPEQPAEELDLTAFPVIGRGREFMGFCPVSQCAYANTPDPDPVRQEQFFHAWLADYKKIKDPAAVAPEQLEAHRTEWSTMAIQRCFLVDERGQPNSFTFTVESVGIRPVQDIVAEGIRAAADLVAPYTDAERPAKELGLTIQPTDSRMSDGVDILFADQEHTLGNLLQTIITELYLDNATEVLPPDSPITYCGYKVRHPLERKMTLRLGLRPGTAGAATTDSTVRTVIAAAAQRARTMFEELGRSWSAATGAGGAAAAPELDG
jgi:DNA-directed RNA polymerase subunit L